jgi:hypothetical protein
MYNFLLNINKKIIMIEDNVKTRTFKHLIPIPTFKTVFFKIFLFINY